MIFFSQIFAIFTLHLYNTCVLGQQVPPNPCPNVFEYYQRENGYIYGRITIPYDGSPTLQLGVNASIKGYYTDKYRVSLKITMLTSAEDLILMRTSTLVYRINFPFQHTIPKITNIDLNRRIYCTGPPEQLIPGTAGVTSLWAGHIQNLNIRIRYPTERYPPISFVPPSSGQRFDNSVESPGFSRNKYQECGVSKITIVPLIVGGTQISEGVFPWLSAIFVSRGVSYEYKCTGNLLSERHVVTAARCIFYYKLQIVQTDDILLIFGRSNLTNWATNGAVTRGVSNVLANPDFNQDSGHADLLIMTLDRPLIYSRSISPICLWSTNIVNKRGTVAGWGTDKRAPKPDQYSVLEANSLDMPIVSNDECLNSNLSYYSLTSDKTFCAGQRDGIGTCIGDVGAGFMINSGGKFSLRGLASIPLLNSKGECDLSFFMVFCDVAKFTDWIKNAIK